MAVEHRAETAFKDYEFEYEPGFWWLWIKWSLRKKDESMMPDVVATGMGRSVNACREKAYNAMVEDYELDRRAPDLGTPVTESGDELARRVLPDPRNPGQPERRG